MTQPVYPMSQAELVQLAEAWEQLAQKREAQAGKQAREGSAMASSYSSGVSAGLSVAANDLRAALKGQR